MRRELKQYIVVCVVSLLCSVCITVVAWLKTPPADGAWSHILWFVMAASVAEFLTVSLDNKQGLSVSPSYTIHWAATCVLGPVPAIVHVVITAILATLGKVAAFRIVQRLEANGNHNGNQSPASIRLLIRFLHNAAAGCPGALPVSSVIFMVIQFIGNLVFFVGPAGLAYHYAGGQYLISPAPHFNALTNFVLPFVVLMAVSICADMVVTIPSLLIMNLPLAGASLREIVLNAKLYAVETFLPLAKPQCLSGVVALSLAYLYARLHLLGFLVAAAPVIALRDFYNQWVAERDAYVDTITTLATYMQHYHPYTRGHLKRVADLSERLARELRLPVESIRFISTAGLLHDIGKIGVSEEILDKTEKLTDEEWERIKEHPVKGAEIISHLEFLEGIVDWIKYHHKWYNGSGYPATNGNGAGIPTEALIIATADAFDAMTDDRELSLGWKCDSCAYVPEDGDRPEMCPKCGAEKRRRYREPKTLDGAIDELRRGAGSQFHPMVVKAFLTMIERDGVRTNV